MDGAGSRVPIRGEGGGDEGCKTCDDSAHLSLSLSLQHSHTRPSLFLASCPALAGLLWCLAVSGGPPDPTPPPFPSLPSHYSPHDPFRSSFPSMASHPRPFPPLVPPHLEQAWPSTLSSEPPRRPSSDSDLAEAIFLPRSPNPNPLSHPPSWSGRIGVWAEIVIVVIGEVRFFRKNLHTYALMLMQYVYLAEIVFPPSLSLPHWFLLPELGGLACSISVLCACECALHPKTHTWSTSPNRLSKGGRSWSTNSIHSTNPLAVPLALASSVTVTTV